MYNYMLFTDSVSSIDQNEFLRGEEARADENTREESVRVQASSKISNFLIDKNYNINYILNISFK